MRRSPPTRIIPSIQQFISYPPEAHFLPLELGSCSIPGPFLLFRASMTLLLATRRAKPAPDAQRTQV
mgnify:CR=1 FL=1